MAVAAADGSTTAVDPRTRILDAALALMSQQGSAAATMRQLAAASDLNVATLYHYFGSKAELLHAVLEERRYGERLSTEEPPLDPSLAPRDRLTQLLEWLWASTLEEEAVFRLLVGEAIRGEPAATTHATALVDALAETIEGWLERGFPEIDGDRAALARLLRSQVFSLVVEHLAVGGVSVTAARTRGEELAAVVFP